MKEAYLYPEKDLRTCPGTLRGTGEWDGLEDKAVHEIQTTFKGEATSLKLTTATFFRKQGEFIKEEHLAFPGYVFVSTSIKNDEFVLRAQECIHRSTNIMRLLFYSNTKEAAMRDEERASMDFLLRGNNCIESSTGFIDGERIFITTGPLVGRESIIKKIHPRRRQVIVEMMFAGIPRQVTLGLEVIGRPS